MSLNHFLLLLLPILPQLQAANTNTEEFFRVCATPNETKTLKSLLFYDPTLITERTRDDETCMHLIAIHGTPAHLSVALDSVSHDPTLLQQSINAIVREENNPAGLSMPVISWFVYGGHVEAVKLLVQHNVNVNAVFKVEDGTRVTSLDLVMLIQGGSDDNEIMKTMQSLLELFFAKPYKDL